MARLALLVILGACYDPALAPDGGGQGPDAAVTCTGAIVSVAAGDRHTCFLDADGVITCVGANDHGQLGLGHRIDQAQPVRVDAGGAAVQIAAGGDTTCARLEDGRLSCWGASGFGQVGTGVMNEDVLSPTPVALSSVLDVAVGVDHTCALIPDYAICWGRNDNGQLGDGTTATRSSPGTGNMFNPPPTRIAVGEEHSCVIATGGQVWCWGKNEDGQLGIGTLGGSYPALTQAVEGGPYVELAAGSDHTCAVRDGGVLLCWGENGALQSDPDGTSDPSGSPEDVPGFGSGVTRAALGEDFTCLVKDGETSCFGRDDYGQGGNGDVARSQPPARVGALDAIDAGTRHACGVAGGRAVCWGDDSQGQLGDGEPTRRPEPAPIERTLEPIASGGNHTCGIDAGGAVLCAGSNIEGESPEMLTFPAKAVELALGEHHACARLDGGDVYCWGGDAFGQLGDGASHGTGAVQVVGVTGAIAIAAGDNHTCAVVSTAGNPSNAVVCWGRSGDGQCGVEMDVVETPFPLTDPNLVGATSLAAGENHTCAIVTGALWCWGNGDDGQLGYGGTVDSTAAVQVVGLASVGSVTGGEDHTCAIDNTQGALCWGRNTLGQLGQELLAPTPVTMPELSAFAGASDLAGGRFFTCAVAEGSVTCAGSADHGELGPTTTLADGTPASIPIDFGVKEVTAGARHACASASDGRHVCWGSNSHGQLMRGPPPSVLPRQALVGPCH